MTVPLLYKIFTLNEEEEEEEDKAPSSLQTQPSEFDIRLKTHIEASQARILNTLKLNINWDNIPRTNLKTFKTGNKIYIIEQLWI